MGREVSCKKCGNGGSILDACERLVDKQHVGKAFRALRSETVISDTAKSKEVSVSTVCEAVHRCEWCKEVSVGAHFVSRVGGTGVTAADSFGKGVAAQGSTCNV